MDSELAKVVASWLAKARSDLRTAKRLICDAQPLLDTGVYHCQQAAESNSKGGNEIGAIFKRTRRALLSGDQRSQKAVKGYLTRTGESFEKTHNLVALVSLCARANPAFEQLREAAVFLTPYAVEFRYPGEVFEPPREEALAALSHAEQALSFVEGQLSDLPD